jgi:hypothetical protein
MNIQPLKLNGRSLKDFEPLNNYPAEKLLLEKCRLGEPAIISTERPQKQTKENTVRASFLRFIALGGDESAPVHEMGVQLHGAWIIGELNLESGFLPHSLKLANCCLSTKIILDYSNSSFLSFSGCHVKDSLSGNYMVCRGSVLLNENFIASGTVSLVGAQIGGNLNCKSGKFNAENDALKCIGAVIKGNVFLDEKFTATSTVDLMAAQIGGSLACNGGKFDGKNKYALICDGAVIEGDALLGSEFTNDGIIKPESNFSATGTVRLVGMQIGKSLACDGGKFNGKGHEALICDRALVKGNVFLGREFDATDTVSLSNAQIGGNLVCDGGKFNVKGKNYALACASAVIEGIVFLRGNLLPQMKIIRRMNKLEAELIYRTHILVAVWNVWEQNLNVQMASH